MPDPTWMRSVARARYPAATSFAERCEYSSRKWCSVIHTYLKPALSAAITASMSSRITWCSASGSCSRRDFGTKLWMNSPNSTGPPPVVGRSCAVRLRAARCGNGADLQRSVRIWHGDGTHRPSHRQGGPVRRSPPTQRVTTVLDTLAAQPGRSFTLAELVERTDISKATCLGI